MRMSLHTWIRLLIASIRKSSRVAGLGQFCSGSVDMGSNKEHLNGFGR